MSSRLTKSLLALFVSVGLTAGGASTAAAAPGDPLPTAPLTDVHPGDTCQARTVLHGTAISSFDVEILEVVGSTGVGFGSLIYFKVVDPDVAAIGVAQGMSGSPILCGIGGEDKVVGAISYGFPGVGPKGFATPIGDVLDGQPTGGNTQSANPPSYRGKQLVELAAPISVTGVPSVSRQGFKGLLEKQGFESVSFVSPAAVDVPSDSADLAPGGAVSLNYSFGDISVGAICTITYRRGNDFWACGHPLDLNGKRALSVSGAYIYDVLGSPWGLEPPFKFGAPTASQVGTALYDGPFAVSGKFGQKVAGIPIRLRLRSGSRDVKLESHVVDEDSLPGGSPVGFSLVPAVAAMMASQAEYSGAGMPTIQSGSICMKANIIGAGNKVNSCNRFVSMAPRIYEDMLATFVGAAGPVAMMTDSLARVLDLVNYRPLRPGAVELDIRTEPGKKLRQISTLKPVGALKAGKKARLRLVSVDQSGKRHQRILGFRIPAKAGRQPGRVRFTVNSTAYESMALFDPYVLFTDSDEKARRRGLGNLLFGRGPITSAKSLNTVLKEVFNRKAALEVSVPGRKKSIRFPLPKGDILIGDAVLRTKLRTGR